MGSIHFWLLKTFRLHFRCGRCTRRSHPATVHCIAMQDQRNYLLNVLELLSNTGSVWKSWGSSNIGTFSLVLLLLVRKVIQALIGHCESTIKLCLEFFKEVITSHCSLHRRTNEPCHSNLSWVLTLQKILDGTFLD